jgi:hypothetical protein
MKINQFKRILIKKWKIYKIILKYPNLRDVKSLRVKIKYEYLLFINIALRMIISNFELGVIQFF